MASLKEVLRRLKAPNLRLKVDKGNFFRVKLLYRAHRIMIFWSDMDSGKFSSITELQPMQRAKIAVKTMIASLQEKTR